MLRLISFAVGAILSLAVLIAAALPRDKAEPDPHAALHKHPKHVEFAQDGIFGKFDRAQLQRGYQVYKEVCAACHSMNLVAFRNLTALGFTEAEVKALAAQSDVPTIDDKTGDETTRKAVPADHFPAPFPNDAAAKAANNGKAPPDLSLIAKARHGGASYLYSILTGYEDKPADVEIAETAHYNPHFAGLAIAMPAPLTSDGQVEYADGTKASIDQMAKDVSAFMEWAAEPKLEDRKRMGLGVLMFLLILCVITFRSYKKIWANVKGH